MSTLLEAETPATTPTDSVATQPRMTGWVTPLQLVAVVGFALLFLYHNYLPLFHSDLWGHVAYGDWILSHRQLPTTDPFAELATGVPVLATAWLGQVVFALVDRAWPVEGLADLFAVVVLLTSLLLVAAAHQRSGSGVIAMVCALLAFGVAWSRHAVQRPEIFGQLGCATLLLILARQNWLDAGGSLFLRVKSRNRWLLPCGLCCLFALWANLHGSFIVGVGVLGIAVVGRLWDRWCLSRDWRAAFCSPQAHREWLALEFAIAGCCVNPYGIDLIVQTIAFPTHPNLKSVLEWYPLEMLSLEGLPMAASWVLTAVVLRKSRRSFSSAEVLLLLALNAAVCLRVRMIAWYAPVWAIVLAPHLADVCQQFTSQLSGSAGWWRQKSLASTAMTVLTVWLTFCLSPISRPILGGKPRPLTQQLSHQTPLGVTNWLQQTAPQGLIYAPQWWGDWLAWRGPTNVRVMATTNSIHLLPAQCWQDYLCISAADVGWTDRLDRYRINTVVVCRELQPDLSAALAAHSEWKRVFQDSLSQVYQRRSLETVSRTQTPLEVTTAERHP
ncbi:hypothetical protein GC163_09960 [bacterium]|nr:hypothetical protein [bacterium]